MGTFILIIMLANGSSYQGGVSVTNIEFGTKSRCEQAKNKVLKRKGFIKRVSAFCVKK